MIKLEENIDALFIAGPTASGKSSAALKIAKSHKAEIINADAMQVYADLRLITARPSPEEEAAVPHHLYGVLEGRVRCSAGQWARMAQDKINQIQQRQALPIIVGGTGLYFRALEDGLSPVPDIPADIRACAEARRVAIGPTAFRDEVIARDPAMAWLPEGDRQRLTRAWEVFEATGQPLSYFQSLPRQSLISGSIQKALILPEREYLYERCNRRFDQMLSEGVLAEIQTLMDRHLDPALPIMKSLGVPELIAHLQGELALEDAVEHAKMQTRRFAKRQMTWFRGQTADWPVVERAVDPR